MSSWGEDLRVGEEVGILGQINGANMSISKVHIHLESALVLVQNYFPMCGLGDVHDVF